MATKLDKVCEIIFNKLRIPVYDREGGKKALEGIFLLYASKAGEPEICSVVQKIGN